MALSFAEALEKDEPGVDAVHIASTRWAAKKPKAKTFGEAITAKGASGLPHPHLGGRLPTSGKAPKPRTLVFTTKPNDNNPIARHGARNLTGYAHKSDGDDEWSITGDIVKLDEDKRLAFGFFSVTEKNGVRVEDTEGDRIRTAEIEKAAYNHVLNARIASDRHQRMGVGDLVESMVFTPEKVDAMVKCLKSMGVDATIDMPVVAWWGGYYVSDEAVWKAVKAGELVAWSIGGSGVRSPDP